MKWGLVIANRAKRHHRRLPLEERLQIDRALSEISDDPLASDVKFLRGTRGVLRRCFGDWRIIFELDREKRIIFINEVNVLQLPQNTRPRAIMSANCWTALMWLPAAAFSRSSSLITR